MKSGGEIIFDVAGKQKENLTVEKLVEEFYKLRHRELDSDSVMLVD